MGPDAMIFAFWMLSFKPVFFFFFYFSLSLSSRGFLVLLSLFAISFTSISITVQPSQSVVSESLQSHRLQHDRLPCCLSPTPWAYSNSYPSSQISYPTISFSIVPFSSHLQSFPASESFPMSQFFASGGQSIGASAAPSVLQMNIQDWSLGWTGWISFQSNGLSRVVNTTVQKH